MQAMTSADTSLQLPEPLEDPTVFLSVGEVAQRVSLSARTIYNLVDSSEFPRPVKLTRNRIAFVEREIEAWMQEKIGERDAH